MNKLVSGDNYDYNEYNDDDDDDNNNSNSNTAIKMVPPRHANGGWQNCWTGCRMKPTGEKEARRTSQYTEGWDQGQHAEDKS
jgi:hypothetical protein